MNTISHATGNLPADIGRFEQLTQGVQGSDGKTSVEASRKELEAAATEFESVFLSMMLKEMRNTLDQENGGLFGGEGSDTFGGMFDMFMSQHLAESKPLGIGNAIQTYMDAATKG